MSEHTEYFVNFAFQHTVGPNTGKPAYAGNIDSKMYGFITGMDDHRHGSAEGVTFHEELVADLFEEDADFICWYDMDTEYGARPYQLCPSNNNAMQMQFDAYGFDSDEEIYRRLRVLADRLLGVDVSGHVIVSINIEKAVTTTESLYTMRTP